MRSLLSLSVFFLASAHGLAEDVIFEDNFRNGLSDKWQVVGLEKKDYRIKDGGLEMRVQIIDPKKPTPMLKVVVPYSEEGYVIASVTVTPLDEFTEDGEYAGVCLTTNGSPEFAAKKQRVKGKLVFAPGKYVFKGKKGEEGDVEKYDVNYTEATKEAGPLRVTIQGSIGFFMIGPSDKGEYKTFFHSALQDKVKERGFCLVATGAPEKANHWVRFTNFRVAKP